MEDIDGGLHPAVDGQSLGEGESKKPKGPATNLLHQVAEACYILVSNNPMKAIMLKEKLPLMYMLLNTAALVYYRIWT